MAMQIHVQVEKVGGQGISITMGVAPERRELYTTADDKLIRIWSLEDGKSKSCITAHKGRITCLVWLNHIRMMMSTSLDHTVALWNAKGECIARSKFPCAIYSAGYSSRHDIVVLGGMKKMFVLQLVHQRDEWELNTQSVFEEHDEFISEIVCTSSGRIFSCGYDGIVCAFDLNVEDKLVVMTAGGHRAKAKCHKGAITCAAYYNEGNSLITGSYDMSVKTWSYDALTAHAQFTPLYTIELKKTVETMCYIPATKSLWVGIKGSSRPFVFDPRTGTNLTDFLPQSEDLKMVSNEHPVKIMASASEVVTMSDHKSFTIWRFNPLACISIIHGHTDWVEMIVKNPRTGDFVSSGADSIVRKWYIPNALYPQLYSMKEGFADHQGSVVAGVLRHDSSILFTGGDDALIRGWSLDDNVPSSSQAGGNGGEEGGGGEANEDGEKESTSEFLNPVKMTLEGHTAKVTAMCMLAHFLISVSVDKSVKIWDSNTGTLWRTIEDAHESVICDVSCSERMDTFATCSSDELCYIWELDTCELCGVMKGHEDEVTKIRWIDELDAWITASDDNSLRLWQASGQPYPLSASSIRSQSDHPVEEPIMMRFDTDGFSALEVIEELGLQAVGLSDYSVQLVDIFRETVISVYKGHYDVVRCIAFLPERNQLLTGSWDMTIRVWSLSGKKRSKAVNRGQSQVSLQEEPEENNKPFADRVPPFEALSVKDSRITMQKISPRESKEEKGELTPLEKKEKEKQQSHMNWVLSCIEEGNEDALKPKNLSRLHGAKAGGSSVMQTKTERGLENTAIARFRKQQGLNTSSSSTVKAKNPAMDGKEQESKKNTTFRQEQR